MKYLIAILALFSAPFLTAEDSTWVLDRSNSRVQFKVNHMTISEIQGEFEDFFVSADLNVDDLEDSKFFVSIAVASIHTGAEQRDLHLRSEDFFDVKRFPEMLFKTATVKKVKKGVYRLDGDLTVKGVSKPVSVDLYYRGMITDYWGNKRVGLEISGAFNRFDFGLAWNEQLEAGGLIVGKEVRVYLNLELYQQHDVNDLAGSKKS